MNPTMSNECQPPRNPGDYPTWEGKPTTGNESAARPPWLTRWPDDGLEAVGSCPACGSSLRSVWHDGLVDSSFRTAPGRWTLQRCSHCASGYLDPRPDAASIHLAYSRYYTHVGPDVSAPEPTRLGPRLRRWVASGYADYRYGTRRSPTATWAHALAMLFPLQRDHWDRQHRHLPRPREDADRLLDVGCGGGDFLIVARDRGWKVCGVDPDLTATTRARQLDLPVLNGGLELLANQEAQFDAITLSHVIEHVHQPLCMLQDCHRLLKPGGILWLETPNVGSYGHRRFGSNWRGLEAPRHLTVFSWQGLLTIMEAAGFADVERQRVPSSRGSMFRQSVAMASGGPADAQVRLPIALRARAFAGRLSERFHATWSEFITLSARRPD